MLQCYNRGCGQKFDPDNNNEDSCRYHPGEPFFHDAYKGWSCCKRRTVDFTEFLNMKGCTLSKHSNEKPPEPEKQNVIEEYEEPARKVVPVIKEVMKRPSFDDPLTEITPTVLPALKEAVDALIPKVAQKDDILDNVISVGTNCKHAGCTLKYTSPESEESECQYHPGEPIFHEGMKYWSCCNKKTSDFTAFMNQAGCSSGKHKWTKEENDKTTVNCRYDWHQTPSDVIIAIYGKLYHYSKSKVKVNPIRLNVCLIFPDQNNAEFKLDLELRGIIKVDRTTVKMYPTKVEVIMPKAEAGSWAKLDFPHSKPLPKEVKKVPTKQTAESDSDVDLDDIEYVHSGPKLTNLENL